MYEVIRTSVQEKYYEVNPDIKKVANEQLDCWLEKFVLEIRKKKEPGRVYPPNTLYQYQYVQNAAARLLSFTQKTEHITPILKELH